MNQSSSLTRKLAASQDTVNATSRAIVTSQHVFRIYTEFYPNLLELTARYFDGATQFFGTGLFEGNTEQSGVIEILAPLDALQSVVHLAGDIKQVNAQAVVLVTYAPVGVVTV